MNTTRSRIQQVALELFTEQGYDKTSLREIAERLGVTKAALYYHFRSKEELVDSFLGDRLADIDESIAWLRDRPHTVEVRQEFVRRYAEQLYGGNYATVMRFFESNQAALKAMPAGLKLRERFRDLVQALIDPDMSLTEQFRLAMGVWALHASWFLFPGTAIPDDQRQAAALDLALDLVSR